MYKPVKGVPNIQKGAFAIIISRPLIWLVCPAAKKYKIRHWQWIDVTQQTAVKIVFIYVGYNIPWCSVVEKFV